MVIADTSTWIPFFTDPGSPEKRAIDALMDTEELVLVGIVLAELLQRCRTPKESNEIVSTLSGLRFLETSFVAWHQAGELSASLRRRGITLPLSDVLIAALALQHRCQVYALDPHFREIPGLALYRPKSGISR